MSAIRVMTYNVRCSRVGSAPGDPEIALKVIDSAAPDIVALQGVESRQASCFAEALGMTCYMPLSFTGTAVLSTFSLRGVQGFDLGFGGSCMRGDADVGGKRLHLFNVDLGTWKHGAHQMGKLLGPDILGHQSVVCPTLVLGDFSLFPWITSAMGLSFSLRNALKPFNGATYPSSLPLVSRDRIYMRGGVRVVDYRIIRTQEARTTSSHLPIVLTLRLQDPSTYLRMEKYRRNQMEAAPS